MTRPTIRSTYQDRPASTPLMGAPFVIGAIALVGLFFLGWWMFEYRINREGEIRRDSFNFQETAREQVVDFNVDLATIDAQLAEPSITDTQAKALTAQRAAIADQLCDVAADITGETSHVVAGIIAEEC